MFWASSALTWHFPEQTVLISSPPLLFQTYKFPCPRSKHELSWTGWTSHLKLLQANTLHNANIPCLSCVSQAEIESRMELEKRLKQAEQALQDLEKGLNTLERSKERDEQMKGDVTQLRSECIHWHLHTWCLYLADAQCARILPFSSLGSVKVKKVQGIIVFFILPESCMEFIVMIHDECQKRHHQYLNVKPISIHVFTYSYSHRDACKHTQCPYEDLIWHLHLSDCPPLDSVCITCWL